MTSKSDGYEKKRKSVQIDTHVIKSVPSIRFSKFDIESKIKILATLVPDEIIYSYRHDKTKHFLDGVLLFVDISGFTDLCEKYNKMAKGGPSRITQVLNTYMGAMVQEIMIHNGDIFKFSGDAFMALWKTNSQLSVTDVVHAAIDCALGIQRSHGTYTTEVGIILRVKIALAAGQIIFSVIGDSNFMILGNTMLEVKELGNLCGPGDIIISSSCRSFLGSNEYVVENIPFTTSVKVITIGSEWTPSYLTNQYEFFDIFSNAFGNENDRLEEDSQLSLVIIDDDKEYFPYSCFLRPSIDYAVNQYLNIYLRKFIIPPVIRAIDLNEPLDYLTEMRQVVIVFINIVTLTHKINNLISLCNETLGIIIQDVQEIGGCLNKTSMFDKDLMFLVIFGLRGFKHSLEAQRALYCAKNLRDKLSRVKFVESASIGVCTGLTYCGVVGHPMRKEYTVIGRTVNKAARLMCAYPNMVSCDSQTYLESRLQARYFTLQPAHYLKGFKNVGPIYRFDDTVGEEDIIEREMLKTKQYPLLDCQKEMEIFFNILMYNTYTSESSILFKALPILNIPGDFHMLVVKGKERQGKTRLLNEIIYFAGDDLDVYKCNFSYADAKELQKYKIFRCLFGTACNLANETNLNTRTQNVFQFIQPFKTPEFLCALNDVLHVNFEETKYYLRLSETKQHFVKSKMIKYLCVKAFKKKCILVVDNIEYIDEESWSLLNAVLNTGLVIFCVTMSCYANLGEEAENVLDRNDIMIITLHPIHKLYHVGLICQFMNVMGVSLELERYIQIHSNGNPGWIESFLTTLINSKGLKILHINKDHAFSHGYVLCPHKMIYRNPEETITSSSMTLTEIKDGSFVSEFDADVEGWDLYRHAIQDLDTAMYKQIPNEITVCDITDNVNFEDMDTEDIMDVSMLRSYDSLKVHEQQLLKCSAILGDCFPRDMLEYVTQNQNVRENAVAIKKLFEIQIFSCGRAKYVDGAIQVRHYSEDPNANSSVKCYCVGFPKNVNTRDLPKYANCGYILFRAPLFREMLCNLLTETQANLYHIRSIWFLESETRRCLDCGLGYFPNLIGETNYDGMKTSLKASNAHASNAIKANQFRVGNTISRMRTQVSDYNTINRAIRIMATKRPTIQSRAMTFTDRTIIDNFLPGKDIKTFFDNNLINCECDTILKTMYKQMIGHCQEAELHVKLMHTLLAFATLCIKVHNITIAFTLLENATELLETKLKFKYANPKWNVPLTKGRIMTLYGQLHIERNAFREAEICLLEALRCYKMHFPKSKMSTKIKIKEYEMRQVIIIQLFPHRHIGSHNENVCRLADQKSEVLSALCALYRHMMIYDKAYLASLWSMNEALKSNSNFYVMCVAYANAITLNIIYTRYDIVDKLEEMALTLCYKKYIRLETHELDAVVRLYGAIFCRKYLCVNLSESLKLAIIVKQLNSPEFGARYIWSLMPLLLQAFIFSYWTAQAALLIQQSSFYCTKHGSYIGKMLYYILCIEFRLYTTYNLVPFAECVTHVKHGVTSSQNKTLLTIEMRYHVAIWLWYIRKENWQSASTFHIYVSNIVKWQYVQEPTMIYVILHLIEGYLILYVRYINTNNVDYVKEVRKIYKDLTQRFKKVAYRLKGVKARFLLLQAYWHIIHERKKKASKFLDKASVAAKNCNMYYESDWIDHTKNNWFQPKTDHPRVDQWQVATDIEMIKTDWKETDSSQIAIPFYTLPLPLK